MLLMVFLEALDQPIEHWFGIAKENVWLLVYNESHQISPV